MRMLALRIKIYVRIRNTTAICVGEFLIIFFIDRPEEISGIIQVGT